jgi:sodium/proline symporter
MTTLIFYLIISAYILLFLSIGAYFYLTTETKGVTDYLLAGRDIGQVPMAVSDAASVQTGFVFLAWVGAGYTTGLFGLWFAFGIAFVHLFIYRFVGPKFRKQSEELDSQTIVDHLSLYTKGSNWSRWIRGVGVLTVTVFLTAYISAQIIAVGELAESTMGINYNIGIVAGGLLVVSYVVLGGFNASIWSDLVQGLVALAAVILLPIIMISEIGGVSVFISQANSIDPSLISMNGGLDTLAFLTSVMVWYGYSLSLVGLPHGVMRLQAIRSERIISSASIVAVSFLSISMVAPLFIGLAGRILYPNIGDPESVALVALVDFLPPWLAGIFAAGVLSIILSTTDSMMLVVSADFTRFYEQYIGSSTDTRSLIIVSRLAVTAIAILGIVIAFFDPGTLFTIIIFATVGLGTSLGVPLMATLWWENVTSLGILMAIVVGLVSTVVNQIYFPNYFSLLAFPATISTIIVVSKLHGMSTVETAPSAD